MSRNIPTLKDPNDSADAYDEFIARLPEGISVEILDALGIGKAPGSLPPKVFFETVAQAPVAISITDAHANILYVNKRFTELTGYSENEILGENESLLSSKTTPASVYQGLWSSIHDKKVWQGTLINRRKNGEDYIAKLTIAPVLDKQGDIAYFLGMHRDVSDLHQLEQRLRHQTTLLESVLDNAPVAMVLLDSKQQAMLDNLAYKKLLGDLPSSAPAKLFLRVLQEQAGLDLDKTIKGGEEFHNLEVRIDLPNGRTRWFNCSGVHVAELDEAAHNFYNQETNQSNHLLLIINDISARKKQIERTRLENLRGQMAEQRLMHTLREALSGAIYQLESPLNMISAALPMIEENGANALNSALSQVLESGNRALEVMREAVPSKIDEDFSRVNLNEILHESLNLATQKILQQGAVVDWRPSTVLPPVSGRPFALREMFGCIIDNALIALHESNGSHRELRISTHTENDVIRVDIIDNGPGVDECMRLKVFEPFYSNWKRKRSNAGMGLAIAQEIASDHSGSIEIDPDFLGGCRVRVRLPFNQSGDHAL